MAKKSDPSGLSLAPCGDKKFTIVIDPGHGGIDGGAEGVNGTVEKIDHDGLCARTEEDARARTTPTIFP